MRRVRIAPVPRLPLASKTYHALSTISASSQFQGSCEPTSAASEPNELRRDYLNTGGFVRADRHPYAARGRTQ
jgi:hypothetical protein